MASQSMLLLFMLSAHLTWGQKYDGPTWPYEDLEKLEHECVSAWRLEFDKKGRLKKDSTLNYALCFNRGSRTLNSVHWNLLQLQDGTLDTLTIVEQLTEYDVAGEVSRSIIRKRDISDMVGPRSTEVVVRKEVRTTTDLSVHRLYAQFYDSSEMAAGKKPGPPKPDYWQVDTTIFEHGRPIRELTIQKACPECGIRVDSIVYTYTEGVSDWAKATSFRDGRRERSTWRQFRDEKLVHRVDSTHNIDYDSTWFQLPLYEEKFLYDGGLLIEKESINWNDSFHFWTFLPGQRHVPRDQPSKPPVRVIKRFEYASDELLRTHITTERGDARDSVTHVKRGIDLVEKHNAMRITRQTESGLPLVITGEQIIVVRPFQDRPRSVIHLHYHNDRSSIRSHTEDLIKYLDFYPSY